MSTVTQSAQGLADAPLSEVSSADWSQRASRSITQAQRQVAQGQPSWTAPTFLNSWTNYGGGFNPAGYYQDAMGRVHLRGLIAGGSLNTEAFALPTSLAPAYQQLFNAMASSGAVRVDVTTAGEVVIGSGDSGTPTWLSLDGIQFNLIT